MFPAEKDPVGGKFARLIIHKSLLNDTVARSVEVDRLGAQAVVGSGQDFLSDLVFFRYPCSAKANHPALEEGTPS